MVGWHRVPQRVRVVGALIALYLLWGSTFLGIRLAVETVPPLTAAAARWLLAGGLLYAFVRPPGGSTWRAWGGSALLSVFLVAASNGGVTWAETRIPSGIASLGIATVAPWLVVLDALRPGGRRPTAITVAGVVLGMLGVASLADPRSPVDPVALVVLLGAAFAFAVGSTVARAVPPSGSAAAATARQMLAGGALLLALGLLGGEAPWTAHPSTTSLLALVWLALSGSLAGFTLYGWLVRSAPAAVVGTYACANPIVALALGAAVLGEPLGPRTLVAAALVVAGVGLVVLGPWLAGPPRRKVDWSADGVDGGADDGAGRGGPGRLVGGPGAPAAQAR
ncbi:MAG: EamA family transporter [Alphaproteobacteria bacterium]|nr:EamA family transporter [Alphaproteobacteria bacterium]MCB9696256.1 EamA family transporter [Alphaproteobacteria bacterium]